MTEQEKTENLIKSILAGVSGEELERQCRDVDLNRTGMHGRTPLMIAACDGLLDAAKILVRNGALVHAPGSHLLTALHEACVNGDVAFIEYLLDQGADIDAESDAVVTPLTCAAAWGNIDATRFLLESGANPNKIDDRGGTAADVAGEKGEDEIANLITSYMNKRSGQ
jgi:uncharacterized protein